MSKGKDEKNARKARQAAKEAALRAAGLPITDRIIKPSKKNVKRETKKLAKKLAQQMETPEGKALIEQIQGLKRLPSKKKYVVKNPARLGLPAAGGAKPELQEVASADAATEPADDMAVEPTVAVPVAAVASTENGLEIVKSADGSSLVVRGGVLANAALVPFANPLVDEKTAKKCFKTVKKAAKHKTLKRGVKEVVKAIRKSPTSETGSSTPHGLVILAADISPMDVISHIPVLCEDHGIPYIFVTSRAELGASSNTKRPTSVIMISEEMGKKEKEKAEESELKEWAEIYADAVKAMVKAAKKVTV